MADSAASTQSRSPRASSTKRRANTVSTETENKLARAARSAQRLPQLSDASRDDSTLDLFPDDPTRATLEAMNIDIRQGTLHGFELPDVMLAAVGAGASGDGMAASSEGRAARRTPRERSETPAATLAGFERLEPTTFSAVAPDGALFASEAVADASAETLDLAASHEPETLQSAANAAPMTPAMAAATVARSVTALRQATEPDADATVTGKAGGMPPQRFAATFARAATASRHNSASVAAAVGDAAERGVPATPGTLTADLGAADASTASNASAVSIAPKTSMASKGSTAFATPKSSAADAGAASSAARQAKSSTPDTAAAIGATQGASGTLRSGAPFAAPLHDAARTTPELDRARATAFADTVDALYGVISDQRRAATDHSRRMKWMLSIVVAALLATVAIGVTQTVLLMRLTRETTAQQHRIEEMMQNQQVAMTSLLDAHLTMANAVTTTPSSASPAPAAAVAPRQTPAGATAAAAPASKRVAKAHAHPHKPKAAATATH